MRNVSFALFALAVMAACVGPYYVPPPQGSYSSPNITINNSSNSSGYAASSAPTRPLAAPREEPTQAAPPPVSSSSSGSDAGGKDPRSVLILQGTHLDRSAEVLGVRLPRVQAKVAESAPRAPRGVTTPRRLNSAARTQRLVVLKTAMALRPRA